MTEKLTPALSSHMILPAYSATVESDDSVWVLGGRERLIPAGGPLDLPPAYKETFTDKIFTFKHDFRESDLTLPMPLAYHCAVLLSKHPKRLFIHGGATNLWNPFNDVLIYHFSNNSWMTLERTQNPCGTPIRAALDQTQCGLFEEEDLVVVPSINSCTAIFDPKSLRWIRSVTDDGREGSFGGVLIRATKGRLLYLGGSKHALRNDSLDGVQRVHGQENVQQGVDHKWVYQVNVMHFYLQRKPRSMPAESCSYSCG